MEYVEYGEKKKALVSDIKFELELDILGKLHEMAGDSVEDFNDVVRDACNFYAIEIDESLDNLNLEMARIFDGEENNDVQESYKHLKALSFKILPGPDF